MKVLLISEERKAVTSYENILGRNKLELLSIDLSKIKDLESALNSLDRTDIRALIMDRVKPDMMILEKYLKDYDVFFIITDWRAMEGIKAGSTERNYRFYLWPTNYTLLIDDIKSICKFKDYVVNGYIQLGKVSINLNTHSLSDGHSVITLKNKEYELLVYLAQNRGKVLSRMNILENVWDMNSQIVTNTVDVHVSKVRKILKEKFGIVNLIKTIPCAGYLLV